MSNMFYTVYLNLTEGIVASGTARECAVQMHKSINGFHSLVSKNTRGIHNKYTIVKQTDEQNSDLDFGDE